MSKKRHVKKKKSKHRDESVLGYPLSIVLKQEKVKAGDLFLCLRCHEQHRYIDGAGEVPGANSGEVLLYRCGERFHIGAIRGHSVLEIEDKLSTSNRETMALLDFCELFTPLALASTEMERQIRMKGVICTGQEFVPIRIPLSVARRLRHTIVNARCVLVEKGIIEEQERDKILFDPDQPSVANIPTLPLVRFDINEKSSLQSIPNFVKKSL